MAVILRGVYLVVVVLFMLTWSTVRNKGQDNCFLTNNRHGLPFFQGYSGDAGRPERRIQHQHQAIIPSYRFNCYGNITEWGVDVNPAEIGVTFDFDLQVWRPSPTVNETGCYSLVDNYIIISTSIPRTPQIEHVARVTPLPQDQLQFQPGDVLGFYVESHGTFTDDDNGVVLLNNASYTSELAWHASITALTSQSGSCPYPVGTNSLRVLSMSTHAAPVISISVTDCSCLQSILTLAIANPTNSGAWPEKTPVSPSDSYGSSTPGGLIAGVVISIVIVCGVTFFAIVLLAVTVVKKHSTTTEKAFCGDSTVTGMAITNQVYGAPEGVLYNASILPNPGSPRYACHASKHKDNVVPSDAYANLNANELSYEVPIQQIHNKSQGFHVPTTEERLNWTGQDDIHGSSIDAHLQDYNRTDFFMEDHIYWAPASTTSDLYSQLASKKYREIPRNQIRTTKALGSGEFGDVCKAIWSLSSATKEVAIKTLKPGSSESDQVRFLQEAAIMGQFNHPYVVKLYGVVTVGNPIMICIELMARGDLKGYLGTLSESPDKTNVKEMMFQLLKFSRQIASGMAYLSKKAFVHRDLAARNVLLDELLNCKISDFGMARDLVDDTYYTVKSKGGKIPVKWTAPEALFYKKYSSDSDVWSYGMVLFEIWSVGKKPFSDLTNNQVVKKLNSGYCQPPPPGCPRAIYKLMVRCWNPVHSQRPPFPEVSAILSESTNTLLEWRVDDCLRDNQLGGQLPEASNLYQELQNSYLL